MKIILVAGWSGSGKDLFGAWLIKHHGFKRFAFADPVKYHVAAMTGTERALLDTVEWKATNRHLLIEAGESKRSTVPEFWGNLIAEEIRSANVSKAVITDWRNIDEFFALQKAFPAAEFYFVRTLRRGERHSAVPSRTEYGLLGFPFTCEVYPTEQISTKTLDWMYPYRNEIELVKLHLCLKGSGGVETG